MLRAARDERELLYVAAGPLEDLLCFNGPAVVEEIAAAAASDETVRRALMGVWGANQIDPEVVRRLREVLAELAEDH